MAAGPAGIIVVTWADGTKSTYTLPEGTDLDTVTDNGTQLKFRAFEVDQKDGVVVSHVLTISQMRGYTKSWS